MVYFEIHAHTNACILIIVNDCECMISECNYINLIYCFVLLYSSVILYVTFFEFFQVMCAVSLVKQNYDAARQNQALAADPQSAPGCN